MTNNNSKSPFLVFEEFLSPKQSDHIVDALNITEPDYNQDDRPIHTVRFSHHCEGIVFSQLEELKSQIEQHFNFKWKGTVGMQFEFYPEDCTTGLGPVCSNSFYSESARKWVRHNNHDFTGCVFLSDFNDGSDFDRFDPTYEVCGGKLQFPQHAFSFNPKRGTMVIFPGVPNFVHSISNIKAGDLFMVRFHIVAETPWFYQPTLFPGNYTTWFK